MKPSKTRPPWQTHSSSTKKHLPLTCPPSHQSLYRLSHKTRIKIRLAVQNSWRLVRRRPSPGESSDLCLAFSKSYRKYIKALQIESLRVLRLPCLSYHTVTMLGFKFFSLAALFALVAGTALPEAAPAPEPVPVPQTSSNPDLICEYWHRLSWPSWICLSM